MSYKIVILETVSNIQQWTLPVGYLHLHLPKLKENMWSFGYPKPIKFLITPQIQWNSNSYATMGLINLRQNLFICKHSAI